jgi:hypothetical protein
MDLQQRQTQHGDRRHHTRYETEPIQNGRVVLASNSPTNGGITEPSAIIHEAPHTRLELPQLVDDVVDFQVSSPQSSAPSLHASNQRIYVKKELTKHN